MTRACRYFLTLCCLWLSPTAFAHGEADHPFDGAWFDLSHDGEGWIVEILPDDTAVVYWFTYPPEGSEETQAWIQGVGRVNGATIEITESIITRGPSFGSAYDRADLVPEDWGTWIMTFSDCDNGTVTYDGPAEFGDGEFSIQRLTALQGSECAGEAKSDPATTRFSGSWFDPLTDGQGITLEVLPDGTALVYWFTYTPDGAQAWVLSVGTANGPRFEFPEVLMPVGTVFGENFDPEAVETLPWGALSLTFDTCGRAVMNYRSDLEGWDDGWLVMQRLTSLGNHPCEIPDDPPLNKGSWAGAQNMTPAVSEIASTVLDGKGYTAGDLGGNRRSFVEFNPANGKSRSLANLPADRHHAMMTSFDGRIYLFGGFSDEGGATDTVWRYIPARDRWTNFTTMPAGQGAAAAVTLGDYIYVVTQLGIIWRLDPATKEWTIIPGPGTVTRDHGNAVAFRGEIWWLAGRGSGQSFNSVDIFDPVTRVWRPGPSLNRAHSGFAAAVVEGQIMLAGGEHPQPPGVRWTMEPSLEVYSPQEGRWFTGPDIPTPVHGVGGVALDGRFYLLGGSTNPGGVGNPGIIQSYVPGG